MADSKDIDTISTELESRLDDLFGEDEDTMEDSQGDSQAQNYPLSELKNLVLSIDWEITDELLQRFLQQLEDLKLTYQHDKIVLTFLQILSSLGEYIKTNRGNAHPKTFKILNSVFSRLDKVVREEDLTEAGKKQLLRLEMSRYKKLREQVLRDKAGISLEKETTPIPADKPEHFKEKQEPAVPDTSPSEPPPGLAKEELPVSDQSQHVTVQALVEAVAEIKKYIHNELEALKEDIKRLREQK